jgi:DMSO/TMAO reductase YedYZ molybdopterin-dependent catalytic subunit
VGAAIAAVPLFVLHVLVRRQRVRPADASRRSALRLGLLTAAGLGAYLLAEAVDTLVGGPGSRRRATGSYESGTDDLYAMPRVSWLFDEIPQLDAATFTVTVRTPHRTHEVPYADLAAGTDEVRAVLDCTGGWYAAQTWRGVRLDRLIGRGTSGIIVVTSATGYQRRFAAPDAASLWLVTHAGGVPLDPGHGAPVRLVAPGRRGFWWVKWVAKIDVESQLWSWQPPFPLQ